jgi:Fe-S-cluster-containing dehydrogenase component
MNRRELIKSMCAAAGGVAAGARAAGAQESTEVVGDHVGMLVDTTRCVGCRMCEYACAEANGLPQPDADVDLSAERTTTPTQWSVVNRYETSRGPVSVKRQCMHCLQPGCAAACLTRAMYKTADGPVAWREGKCMGCRFCMISCPFEMPKFEYDSPVPRIQKCQLCWERLQEGRQPACAADCPAGAITFGRRMDLLEEGRRRICRQPERYVRHIYGEHEVGGTGWLYLASVPFGEIGFKTDVGTTPYPVYTKQFLYAVPVVLTLLPPFLLAVARSRGRTMGEEGEQGGES